MQKVTNFLEQHVQWVAIGLGALFALSQVLLYLDRMGVGKFDL